VFTAPGGEGAATAGMGADLAQASYPQPALLHACASGCAWLQMIFRFSAVQNTRASDHQFWTHESHAVELRGDKFFLQRLNYIHQNPVRADLVREVEHYVYSSAADYYHGRVVGPVPVTLIEVGSMTNR